MKPGCQKTGFLQICQVTNTFEKTPFSHISAACLPFIYLEYKLTSCILTLFTTQLVYEGMKMMVVADGTSNIEAQALVKIGPS